MSIQLLNRALVGTSFIACFAAAQAQTFNYAADFSILNGNPNGAWQYGHMPTVGGLFTAHNIAAVTGDTLWWSSVSQFDLPGNFKNAGTLPGVGGLAPGAAAIHPGFDPFDFGVARFASGIAGDVTITGSFGQGDFGLVDVYILKNGVPLFSVINTITDEPFSLTTSLIGSDTIDFLVGRNNIINGDTTPLDATLVVTPIPEPASVAALGLGLVAIARWRQKR